MSTILDALRRLEKDGGRPGQASPPDSWLDAPAVDESALGRVAGFILSRSRAFWVVCTGLVCLAGVVAAVGIGMVSETGRRSPLPEQAPGPQWTSRAAPENRTAARADRASGRPEPAKRSLRPPAVSAPAPAPARQAPPAAGTPRAASRPPAAAAPAAGRPALPEKAGAAAPGKSEPLVPPAPATSAEERQDAVDPGGRAGIESLPAAVGFALQAVSWSEQPARRIAVINGSILKEGEKLEEYTVFEINRDDVIFQRQGQLWRLDFRKK